MPKNTPPQVAPKSSRLELRQALQFGFFASLAISFPTVLAQSSSTLVTDNRFGLPSTTNGLCSLDESLYVYEATKKVDYIEQACTTQEIITLNKGPGVTLGSINGIFTPLSCLLSTEDNSQNQKCATQLLSQKNLLPSTKPEMADRFKWVHHGHKREYENWQNKNMAKVMGFLNQLRYKPQLATFQTIIGQIEVLRASYFAKEYALKGAGGVGNCVEHASIALHKLLAEKMRAGNKIKIQYVRVEASQVKKGIRDHVYLLLDSNMDDKHILKNRRFVEDYFEKITKGKICDPWNEGFYMAIKKNNNRDFYQRGAGWDTLDVTTIEINFKGFDDLPDNIKTFICNELMQMSLLSEHMLAACPRMAG